MLARAFTALSAGALVLTLAGCRRTAPAPDPSEPLAFEAIAVGCDAVSKESRCEVATGQTLTVVVDAKQPVVVSARATRERTCADAEGLQGSPLPNVIVRSLEVPDGSEALCITARGAHGAGTRRIALAKSQRPPWLREANRLRKSGDAASANVIARDHEHDAGLDGARAQALLGRLALARGAIDEATQLLRDAVAREATSTRWSEEAEDRFALAYTLATHSGQSDEANTVLAADVLDTYPEARAKRTYYRAIIAHHDGDPRRGLERAAEAMQALGHLGLENERRDAEELRGLLLWRIGRASEARDLFIDIDRRTSATTPPCTRATRLVNAARTSIEAWYDAGQPAFTADSVGPREARSLAQIAIEVGDAKCPGGLRHANAEIALAEANASLGEPAAARKYLEDARAATPHPQRVLRLWWHETMARVLLAEGRALEAARELDVARAFVSSPQDRWMVERLRGLAFERAKHDPEAILAYEEAERVLDTIATLVPLGEGRALAAESRKESASALVGILLRNGEPKRALDRARRARTRVVTSIALLAEVAALDEQARRNVDGALAELRRAEVALDEEAASSWATPTNDTASRRLATQALEATALRAIDRAAFAAGRRDTELPPLDPAEIVLFLGDDQENVRVLAAHRGQLEVRSFPAPRSFAQPDETFTKSIIDVLEPMLADASRVRVLASGQTANLEVHALSRRGAPLAKSLPVVHALDLGPRATHVGRGALVVADPSGDLPGARAEADRVMKRLTAEGDDVTLLFQKQADAAHVRSALEGKRLFHFAGHAIAGGRDASSSGLVLAERTWLSVAGVLGIHAAPQVVVLSACEAAKNEDAAVASLGLAHAFLIAGSSIVVAPLRRVPDDFASALSVELHAYLRAGADPGEAFTAMLRAHVPDGDWPAFRVLVR